LYGRNIGFTTLGILFLFETISIIIFFIFRKKLPGLIAGEILEIYSNCTKYVTISCILGLISVVTGTLLLVFLSRISVLYFGVAILLEKLLEIVNTYFLLRVFIEINYFNPFNLLRKTSQRLFQTGQDSKNSKDSKGSRESERSSKREITDNVTQSSIDLSQISELSLERSQSISPV
jgi:hypothetical protein